MKKQQMYLKDIIGAIENVVPKIQNVNNPAYSINEEKDDVS